MKNIWCFRTTSHYNPSNHSNMLLKHVLRYIKCSCTIHLSFAREMHDPCDLDMCSCDRRSRRCRRSLKPHRHRTFSRMKTLVWFWIIDETWSTNLYVMCRLDEVGTCQVMEQVMSTWWWWWWPQDDQALNLERKKDKNKLKPFGDQGNGIA